MAVALLSAAVPTGVYGYGLFSFQRSSGGAGKSSRALTKAEEPEAGAKVTRSSPFDPASGRKNSLTTPAGGGEKDWSRVRAYAPWRTETANRALEEGVAGSGKKWSRRTRNVAGLEQGML